MEISIYKDLEEFKDNYLVDFSVQSGVNLLQYLLALKKQYMTYSKEYENDDFKDIDWLEIERLYNELDDSLPYQSYAILKNDFFDGVYNPEQYLAQDFIQCPELIQECIDLGKEQDASFYENIRALFTLKKKSDEAFEKHFKKLEKINEIVKFIDTLVESEKNILIRLQGVQNTHQSIEHPFSILEEEDSNNEIWETSSEEFKIFDRIRYEDISFLERTKIIKTTTEGYQLDLLLSFLKDLEFYLFVEKDRKETQYSLQEIEKEINKRQSKNLPIPYFKQLSDDQKTKKQKEFHKKLKEGGIDIDTPVVNIEALMFPYEFFPLYEFEGMIRRKIKEISPSGSDEDLNNMPHEMETLIDTSQISTNKSKNIALLHYTGILDFLRSKYPKVTDNKLAGFFELLTKEPITARGQSSHFTGDKSAMKYPIRNKEDERDLDLILSKFGMQNNPIKPSSEK